MKAAQTKWKNLRDYFRRELKKIPLPRSGDPGDIATKSHWPPFKSLLFLKDQFAPRSSTGNLVESQDDNVTVTGDVHSDMNSDDEIVEMETFDETQNTVDEEPATPISISSENSASTSTYVEPRTILKSRLRKRKNPVDDLLAIEQQKLELIKTKRAKLEETKDDDHTSFFKSLLPHARKIPDGQIFKFRNEVQDLVQRYAYGSIATTQLHTFNYRIDDSTTSTQLLQTYNYPDSSF